MSKFLIIFVALLVSCGPQAKRNAEVTVSYNGVVESYYHPDYNTEQELINALADDTVPDFVIFSSPHCSSCSSLNYLLRDLGWRGRVIVLNIHEKWVTFIAQQIEITSVPAMVIDTDRGKTISKILTGTGEISHQLYKYLGVEK